VLLAEDNVVNQRLTQRVLENNGCHVTIAVNGCETLDLYAKQGFDAILMDVQMPVMDGLATTAAIRDHEEIAGGHVPIVAMTAHALKGDRERCLQAGMDGYLSKPVRAAELLASLRDAIGMTGAGTVETEPLISHLLPAEPNDDVLEPLVGSV
jgi:CheY-like chemotaxis protein